MSGTVFDNNHKEQKLKFVDFVCFLVYAPLLNPDAPTFQINDHEAFV